MGEKNGADDLPFVTASGFGEEVVRMGWGVSGDAFTMDMVSDDSSFEEVSSVCCSFFIAADTSFLIDNSVCSLRSISCTMGLLLVETISVFWFPSLVQLTVVGSIIIFLFSKLQMSHDVCA
jgi:hypothetical protein